MLKRVITAVVLSAVTLCALLLGRYALWGLLLLAQVLCMWEMLSAAKIPSYRWVYLLYAAALMPVTVYLGTMGAWLTVLLGVLAAFTVVTLRTEPDGNDLLRYVLPAVYPAVPMTALALLIGRESENWLLFLYLTLAVPIGCDTLALFIGKAFGKHKLIPAVSPNKTVEGAWGGVLGGMIGAFLVWLIAGVFLKKTVPALWIFLILGLFGAVFSEVGDLVGSYIKRVFSVKDFGKIFPGHGGMLDRLDSILFSAVFMLCVLNIFPL